MTRDCHRAKVSMMGNLAIVVREDGGVAAIPKDYLCKLVEKLNLCLENYKC